MCGEHQDLAMERGREKGEGERQNTGRRCAAQPFLWALTCHLAHQCCSVQPGERKTWCGSAGPSREGWVQSLGWLRAHLAVAAIYSWGRWSVIALTATVPHPRCLKGKSLQGREQFLWALSGATQKVMVWWCFFFSLMKTHFYQSALTGARARAQQCWSKHQLSGPPPHLLGQSKHISCKFL